MALMKMKAAIRPYLLRLHCQGNENALIRLSEQAYTLEVTIETNGAANLFCGRAADSLQGEKIFLPAVVAGNTRRMLGMLGRIYERASYYGMVDVGVAITSLQNCINDRARFGLGSVRRYDGPDYRKTLRTSALNLVEDPKQVAESLLKPIFDALY